MIIHSYQRVDSKALVSSGVHLSKRLSYLISVAVLLKIMAFIFLNYDDFALLLNYGSFALLALAYVLCFSFWIVDLKGLLISAYIGCLVAILYLHSTILGVETELTSVVLFPIIISTFYILPVRLLAKEYLDFVLSAAGVAIITKVLINFGILLLLISGYISSDKDSLQVYFGKMAEYIVSYDSFGMIKLYEKSLIFLPLAFYLFPVSKLIRFILVCIIILGCVATLTISIYATLFILALLFLFRDLSAGRHMKLMLYIIFLGFIFVYFSSDLSMLFAEKEASISVKVNQYAALSSFDNLLGVGIGSSGVPTIQSGDVFIENSYLQIYYWLGFLSIIFYSKIIYLLLISINNIKSTRSSFLCAGTIISIFLNSASNAFIFSGGVLVAIFVCVSRFDFKFKFI